MNLHRRNIKTYLFSKLRKVEVNTCIFFLEEQVRSLNKNNSKVLDFKSKEVTNDFVTYLIYANPTISDNLRMVIILNIII